MTRQQKQELKQQILDSLYKVETKILMEHMKQFKEVNQRDYAKYIDDMKKYNRYGANEYILSQIKNVNKLVKELAGV
jgi:hypothetical protein